MLSNGLATARHSAVILRVAKDLCILLAAALQPSGTRYKLHH